jgi:hypothetical protein
MAANQFNNPPAAGHQFFIATVRATYTGAASERFGGSYTLRAVGASAVAYSTFTDSCGVIPDPIPDSELFTGGAIQGNVCWSIASPDAASLLMFHDTLFADDKLFFAL